MRKFALLITCMILCSWHVVFAQSRTVTGQVTDADDGNTLPGVSVVVKGTSIGTVTDINGEFSLTITDDAQFLMFSFVGMRTTEVEVSSANTYNVQLEKAAFSVDEVVVTALGIKKSEKALGYASTTVSSDEIVKTRTSDVMGALAGKVAGVDVSVSSSSPGASNAVIIRGMSSLGGSNQPLYVVDGIPIINNASISGDGLNSAYDFGAGNQMVNPDDVESLTVLKGAAASALYGNRASNGVILITTKQGRKGEKLSVVVNSTVQMSDILRLPGYQNDFGMGWDGHHTLLENGSWGPKLDGTLRPWGTIYNNSQKVKPFSAKPSNVEDFFDYGMKFQNSVSVSGGSNTTTYYASFSQVDEDGIIPTDNDSFSKKTFSLRGTHEHGKLKVITAANVSRQNNNFVPTGQGFTVINNISQIPRDVSIVSLADYQTDAFDNIDHYFTPYGVINPYFALNNNSTTFDQQKVFGKFEANYSILNNLSATYRVGFDASDNEQKIASPRLVTTPGTPNDGQVSDPGSVYKSMSRRTEINQDLFVNYIQDFGVLGLDALVGVNSYDYKFSSLRANIANLDIPSFYDLSNTSETPSVMEGFSQKRMVGAYANVEFSYEELLYLTLTGRQDWTSTLPQGNNSYFYPGVQMSFIFSDLLPDNTEEIISFGKLRLAWGKVGKDAEPYLLDPYFVPSSIDNPFGDINFPIGGINAFEVGNRLANITLQPEIRTESEAGLRMDFLQGRVGFDVTVYQSVSTNQIYNLGLDPSTGYTSQTTNIGEIENKGMELMVNALPVKTKDFTWRIDANYTKNNEKLVSLPEELGEKVALGGLNTIGFVAQVGQPLGLFEATVPQRTASGQLVVDEDGQPVAASEKAIIPKAAFDYTVGVTNTFSYKNFTFSFDFDIRQGGLIYSRTKDINLFTGNLLETVYNDRRPFVVPNSVQAIDDVDGIMDDDGSADQDFVENSTPIADDGLVSYFSNGQDKLDEAFLLPRSYVKLKRIVLAYDLPKSVIKNLPINGLGISVYGNNLMLWTPAENYLIDPEATTFGNDLESKYGEFSANPPTRNFGVNVKITF